MPTFKQKRDLIEDLNSATVDLNSNFIKGQYTSIFNKVLEDATKRVKKGKGLTQRNLRRSVLLTQIQRSVRNAYVISAVSQLIRNDKDRKVQRDLKTVKQVMDIANVRNPLQFVKTIDKLVLRSVGGKQPLSKKEFQMAKSLNRFMNANKEEIQTLVNDQRSALKKINQKITTNLSRDIIKERRRLINKRIIVKGVKRPLTNQEIANELNKKFINQQARVSRIVNTEMNRQNQLVGLVQATSLDFKFKTWNTQRDVKVRDTHEEVDRVKIPINAKFTVGGHKCSQPLDPSLPIEETAHCRCFLTYSNR
jgi:hypothetical protein